MALLRAYVATPTAALRTFLVVAAIVVVATLVTIIVGGPGAGLSFDLTSDPMGVRGPW
jgi:hypothetical protein